MSHVEQFKLKRPDSRTALDTWGRLIRENHFNTRQIGDLSKRFHVSPSVFFDS